MEIRRLSKFSKIVVFQQETAFSTGIPSDKIIQIVTDEHYIAIEYIPSEFIESYLLENTKQGTLTPTDKEAPFDSFPQKTQEQMELETALDTVLNNDPLGRYNGCNLRVPFDKGDAQWVEWVLANMHNKFIKDKVKLIKGSGYGNFNS